MEQRATTRYKIELPVFFRWQDKEATHHGRGLTRNMSTGGLFITSSRSPVPSANLTVEIRVSWSERPAQDVRLNVKGRVIRVEEGGFAVEGAISFARGTKTTGPVLKYRKEGQNDS